MLQKRSIFFLIVARFHIQTRGFGILQVPSQRNAGRSTLLVLWVTKPPSWWHDNIESFPYYWDLIRQWRRLISPANGDFSAWRSSNPLGHYLNQCWVIFNWTLRNKTQWHFIQNTKRFIHKNTSKNIVCERGAILSRGGGWGKTDQTHCFSPHLTESLPSLRPNDHICVDNLTIIGSDNGFSPSHYPNQCRYRVNWILRNKLQGNFSRNSYIFIQENAFENVGCEMAAILSRPQYANKWSLKLTVSLWCVMAPWPGLVPMMACCLKAPSHCLNQYWLTESSHLAINRGRFEWKISFLILYV